MVKINKNLKLKYFILLDIIITNFSYSYFSIKILFIYHYNIIYLLLFEIKT